LEEGFRVDGFAILRGGVSLNVASIKRFTLRIKIRFVWWRLSWWWMAVKKK
jgi:hypothetical protein